MAVRFIFGRAGSGKTQHCVDRIVESARESPLGPPIYYVVPKQATFSVQRRLALAAGLPGGFCRVRVVPFERLADDVIAECGGDAIPAVTPRGRRIVLAHLLRTLGPKLHAYRASADRLGLADELDATFAELEHHGHDANTIADLIVRLAEDADPDPPPARRLLLEKLHDLHLLYGAYQDFLTDERVDPHRRLQQVLRLVRECSSLRQADVYIDGHLDFSHFECQLVAALGGSCRKVEITMLLDPAEPTAAAANIRPNPESLFHRTERAYERLRQTMEREGIVAIEPLHLSHADQTNPAIPEELSRIERSFLATHLPIDDASGEPAIEAHAFIDRRTEAAAVATIVKRWMRELDLRPRQIAVLCRRLEPWHELLEVAFNEREIPFFSDRRRTASHHPLLQTVSSTLQAALNRFPHEAMIAIAKSGLCGGVSRNAADELENYVLRHAIIGETWASETPWAFNRRDASSGESSDVPADFANATRLLVVEPIIEFARTSAAQTPRTVREFAAALVETLAAYGVERTLTDWINEADAAGELELAAEHEQVWEEFVDLLDETVDLLGDVAVAPQEFADMIATALASFDLAIAPATVDQVIVGDLERTRFNHYQAVVLVGWNESEFPSAPAEETVLGDRERNELHSRSFSLEDDANRRLLDEPLLAYLGLTRARRRVCITRHMKGDAGRELGPSPYWRELSAIVPRAFPTSDADEPQDAATTLRITRTPREVAADLAQWARRFSIGSTDERKYHALYERVIALPEANPLRRALALAWPALSYRNLAELSPRTIARLFGPELNASVSQLESFANCPYQHFAKHTLRLRPRPMPAITALDLGSLFHETLQRLVKDQIDRKVRWGAARPSRADVQAAARLAGERLRGEMLLATARNGHLLRTIEESVHAVLDRQHTIGAGGAFSPVGVEVSFGLEEVDAGAFTLNPLSLATPKKRTLRLRGRIDRVDVSDDGRVAAVFDYKSSREVIDLNDLYYGLSLQLLTYLLVLLANDAEGQNPLTPAAAFYVRLLRRMETTDSPEEAAPVKAIRGLINIDHLDLLESGVEGNNSKHFSLGLLKDGTFGKRRSGDATSPAEFFALLAHVKRTLTALADGVIDGNIDVRPFRLGDDTPCPHCDFRSVCRFEPPINTYLSRKRQPKPELLQIICSSSEGKQ